MRIGYLRVGKRPQDDSLDTQESILQGEGSEQFYREKISGAWSARPEFDRMLAALRSGYEFFAARHERLGRAALDTFRTIDERNTSGVHMMLMKPEIDTWTKERLASVLAGGREGGWHPSISESKRQMLVNTVRGGKSVCELVEKLGISRSHSNRILGETEQTMEEAE